MEFEFKMTLKDECTEEYESRLRFTSVQLDDILVNFSQFLRGCGFIFDGEVEIVKPDNHRLDPDYE